MNRLRSVRFAVSVVLSGLLLLAVASCKAPLLLPEARFSFSPTRGPSPLVVRFDASASGSPGGAIIQYLWDFGDGEQGSGLSAAHTFTTPIERTFDVALTVIDQEGRQASARGRVEVMPEEIPAVTNSVEFVWPFHFDADGDDAANLNDEYVTLQNTGELPVDMGGWQLGNEGGDRFVFPSGFVLAPRSQVTIHSGAGVNSDRLLYWNAIKPIWSDTSDIAILYDAAGGIVDIYAYASC